MRTRIPGGNRATRITSSDRGKVRIGSPKTKFITGIRSLVYGSPSDDENLRLLEDGDFRLLEDGSFRLLQ